MKLYLLAALALLLQTSSASARQRALESASDLGAAVEAGSVVTYLDLVRLVFPVADGDDPAVLTRSVPLSHAYGDYSGRTFKGALAVSHVERVFIRSDGERLAVLLIHASPVNEPERTAAGAGADEAFNWGGISVLAAYRLTPAPRLLGTLEVKGDRETSLWDAHPVTALGARDSGVWFVNSHHNAGEEFRDYALAGYVRGGLRLLVAPTPTLHSWRGCRRGVTESARVETVRARGRARRDVAFVVTETVERFAADCSSRVGRARRRTTRRLFSWDARRGLYEERGARRDRRSTTSSRIRSSARPA